MDNAIDAIWMAFAVLIFVIALSLSMMLFGKAKETSEQVFYYSDKTNFYDYDHFSGLNTKKRIVGTETIVPTIYRYYKEPINVVILNKEGKKVAVYNSKEENEFNNNRNKSAIGATYDYVSWGGNSNEDAKRRIDLDLSGEQNQKVNNYKYTPQLMHSNSHAAVGGYTGGLLKWLNDDGTGKARKFEETFLEQRFSGKEITSSDNESLELVKGSSVTWIIYKEI